MGNYIREHWAGKQSLVRSYWINSVIASWGVGFVLGFLLGLFGIPQESIVKVASITATPYMVWAIVGTWRSSDAYTEMNPSKGWGGLAKAGIIVGFISYMANILR